MFQTCVCIWKNGKETVECINRDLGEIPTGIEPSTQVSNQQTLVIIKDCKSICPRFWISVGIVSLY